MKAIDRQRCIKAGANESAFEPVGVTYSFETTRLAQIVLAHHAAAADVPVETFIRQMLDSWAADEFVKANRLAEALAAARDGPAERPKQLYFMRKGEDGPIKIGVSIDHEKRAKGLSTGSDEPIAVLLVIEQDDEVNERALHQRFAAHRKNGEWFEPCAELLDLIATLRSGAIGK